MLIRVKDVEAKRDVELNIVAVKNAILNSVELIEVNKNKFDIALEKIDEVNKILECIKHDRDSFISKEDIIRYIKCYSRTLSSVSSKLWDLKYSIMNPRWVTVNEGDSKTLVKAIENLSDKLDDVDSIEKLVILYNKIASFVSELSVVVEEE